MTRHLPLHLPALAAALLAGAPDLPAQTASPALTPFVGTWVGAAAHNGQRTTVALTLVPADGGTLEVRLHLPVIHVRDLAIGRVRREGATVTAGPFALAWDSVAGTLTGVLPAAIVPVHEIQVTLRRGDLPPSRSRPTADTPLREPLWRIDVGAPIWADPVVDDDLLLVGADDGRVHARDARTGDRRWVFQAGGAIRAPVTADGPALYVHADDGFLYRLDRATGTETWRVRTTTQPIERHPPPGPNSRWDTRASAAVVAAGRLLVGTHDGRTLALDPADGRLLWEFTTGGSILAAPVAADGRVFVGSYDGRVYALDATSGALLWTYDTGAPVTSTPVPWGNVVVAGSRSYDLAGLDAATGAVIWNRYVWFSWIESTPAVRDDIAYVGSSDAALVMAIEIATGRSLWDTDVLGASWGTPAVTDRLVFVGTRGQAGAFTHAPGALALDRVSGRPVWRFPVTAPAAAPFSGFAGSPTIGGDRVIFAAVDGQVYAFDVAPLR